MNREIWIYGNEKSTGECLCEKDVILPDLYNDIKKILWYKGSICPQETLSEDGRILWDGKLSCTVLFLDEKDCTCSLSFILDYHGISLVETGNEVRAVSVPNLDSLQVKALNPRKMGVRAKISGNVKIFLSESTDPQLPEAFRDQSSAGVETATETAECSYLSAFWDRDFTLSEDIALEKTSSEINQILASDLDIQVVSIRAGEGSAEVTCEVNLNLLYQTETEELASFSKKITVSKTIETPGTHSDTRYLTAVYPEKCSYTPVEDMTGQNKIVSVDLSFTVCLCCGLVQSFDHVTDLYSIYYESENQMTDYRVSLPPTLEEVTVSRKIGVENGKGDLLAASGVGFVQSVGRKEDGLYAFLECTVSALFDGEESNVIGCTLSDRFEWNLPDRTETLCRVSITNFSQGVENGEKILRYDVKLLFLCWNTETIHTLHTVRLLSENPICDSRPLILYFPTSGESEWQIAKKYKVSRESLKKINSSGNGGTACLIPARKNKNVFSD